MTAPTHRQYSVTFALLANIALYWYGVTEINYYLALPIILLTSKSGALFPDVDHKWDNVKEKTVPNKIVNTLIHITGGKHRSWQTHSIDIVCWFLLASFFLPKYLFDNNMISSTNKEVMSILMLGFGSGWVSHIISDMLTHAGVRLFCFWKKKFSFVPKSIGNLRFNTGNEWEAFCYKTTKRLNIPLGLFCLIFPSIANGTLLNLINNLVNLIK